MLTFLKEIIHTASSSIVLRSSPFRLLLLSGLQMLQPAPTPAISHKVTRKLKFYEKCKAVSVAQLVERLPILL